MNESTGDLRCVCGDLKSAHFAGLSCMVPRCPCMHFHADLGTALKGHPAYGDVPATESTNGLSFGPVPATDPGPAQRTDADTGRGSVPLVAQEVDLRDTWEIARLRQEVASLTEKVQWRECRMYALQVWQTKLPEPFRTECCNILANGKENLFAAPVLDTRDEEIAKLKLELAQEKESYTKLCHEWHRSSNIRRKYHKEEMDDLREHYEERIADLERDLCELRGQHALVVNALCPECGRSQQPDGDCYGCAVDGLQEENARLKEEVNRDLSYISLAEDAGAQAQAWSARVDALVAREKEARWLIENCPCDGPDRAGYLPRRAAWLKGRKEHIQ